MLHIKYYFKEPWRIVASSRMRALSRFVPDKLYLECKYMEQMNMKLNWEDPQDYTQKLQWLKLRDFKPEYTKMVDKYLAKEYVAERIGAQYIIPTYGAWDRFEDINFDELPDQFVLKCNHDSSSVIICLDKKSFDVEKARCRLTHCLKRDFFRAAREYPYKYVKRKIIAEAYIEDAELRELRDYKFFTFNGEPKLVHVVSNRQNKNEETYGDFFDMDYRHVDLKMGHNFAPQTPQKPKNFEKMKEFARILSAGTRHLRVDFYEANGNLYFGELTFYQDAGWVKIEPYEWNVRMGSWITLD